MFGSKTHKRVQMFIFFIIFYTLLLFIICRVHYFIDLFAGLVYAHYLCFVWEWVLPSNEFYNIEY